MEPEYWQLGEAVQDRILDTGLESDSVEGIAVDIHDLLQAADQIRDSFAPAILAAEARDDLLAALKRLQFEFGHIRWHCENGATFLQSAIETLERK